MSDKIRKLIHSRINFVLYNLESPLQSPWSLIFNLITTDLPVGGNPLKINEFFKISLQSHEFLMQR